MKTHILTVCHECACFLANGEGSPEHEEAFDEGIAKWGGYITVDTESVDIGVFTCSICGQHSYGPAYPAEREARNV